MGILNKSEMSKRILIMLLLGLVLIGAVGCQYDNALKQNDGDAETVQQNKIIKADLTNREVNIINGTGCSKYFMFDVQLVDEFSYVSIWVDKYEYGEMTGTTFGGLGSTLNKESNLLNMMMTTHHFKEEDEKWVITIGGASSSTMVKQKGNMMSVWQSVEEIEIKDGQETIVAVILNADIHNDERTGMSGVPAEFFMCTENCEEYLKEYDYAYVLKAKFTKADVE
jgi:hypothetical protein